MYCRVQLGLSDNINARITRFEDAHGQFDGLRMSLMMPSSKSVTGSRVKYNNNNIIVQ